MAAVLLKDEADRRKAFQNSVTRSVHRQNLCIACAHHSHTRSGGLGLVQHAAGSGSLFDHIALSIINDASCRRYTEFQAKGLNASDAASLTLKVHACFA